MKAAQTYVRIPSISLRASLLRERVEAMGELNAGKLEAQLAQWGAKLDQLVAKTGEAATGAKADFRKQVDELRAKTQLARTKLDELGSAGGAKWQIFKSGFESAWIELETTFKKLSQSKASKPAA
jgi:uncharacterized NAD(P)/FAD-binding protein YdhS